MADLLTVMMSANPNNEMSCQLSPVRSQWIMLENFCDIETEDEKEQRLILKGQQLSSEARKIVADAEQELMLLGPLLKENQEFVVYWSDEIHKAQLKRDGDREIQCRAALSGCQQAVSKIQARIAELEKVRSSLLTSLEFIKLRGTHA